MEQCANHPEMETPFVCSKYNVYMCVECLRCHDSELYCKYRSSCFVHFIQQRTTSSFDESSKKIASIAQFNL